MDEIIDVDSPEQRIAMRKRHLEIGLRMQRVAITALEELEQKIAAGKPLGLTGEEAKVMFDAGRALEVRATDDERRDGDDPSKSSSKKPN